MTCWQLGSSPVTFSYVPSEPDEERVLRYPTVRPLKDLTLLPPSSFLRMRNQEIVLPIIGGNLTWCGYLRRHMGAG